MENIINNKLPNIISPEVKPEHLLKRLHSAEGRLAETIASFAGSMGFAYFHAIWFSFWILTNHGVFEPFIPIFDPFPYGLLTMIVSLEAIFLATFIMITQNRQALLETYRELEEEKEQEEEEKEQEEFVEDVQDIQKDLDDIKKAIIFIQQKVTQVEKLKNENGNGKSNPPPKPQTT